jgi:hypothetical protein
MSEQPTKRRTSPWIVWPACLFILVLMYLASYGPFLWLYGHDYMSDSTCTSIEETVYFPYCYVEDNTNFFTEHPIGRAYMGYLRWFVGY